MTTTQTLDEDELRSIMTDKRRNLSDANGQMWYVLAPESEQLTHGPFGSQEQAVTVRNRADDRWPEDLVVESISVDQYVTERSDTVEAKQ